MWAPLPLLCFAFFVLSEANFTFDFNRFLDRSFGPSVRASLERTDLGSDASIGGRTYDGEAVKRDPVIIVHGVTNKVQRFFGMRDFLLGKNYSSAEIYGTTYGDAGATFAIFVRMRCDYVKQIRRLIMAVHKYTKRKVAVLAYSLGSPIARKAILGGYCAGTSEYLGHPIGYLVSTFVSIAGANYGSQFCYIPLGICNSIDGLHCSSQFLKDINRQPSRYEADRTFALFSMHDDKVGYKCCDTECARLVHSARNYSFPTLTHDQIMDDTMELQYQLVNGGDGDAATTPSP
ncbi:hypothetical protein QR680_017926 [Steinernema hermaphroditum]|uniref:Lipase domain-containing protein n=1 Tax=Steinernema hermaphroditum TaxID=289476 RepID=A0AA39HH95_9BILA|nr:hypothetical protein QR680_017926 [Steinernema hermaphroditum]